MNTTESPIISDATSALAVRCKWCVNRIGEVRYRLTPGGEWEGENPMAYFTFQRRGSDGICPECLATAKSAAHRFQKSVMSHCPPKTRKQKYETKINCYPATVAEAQG
jgi:hypothetical protein